MEFEELISSYNFPMQIFHIAQAIPGGQCMQASVNRMSKCSSQQRQGALCTCVQSP